MRALTGGSEGRARVRNTITGGRFGNVVQADRIEALHIHVHDPERELPRSRRLLYGLAALLTGAAAYLAQRYGPLPGLLALASAALTGTAALSRTLERRRFARPRKPVAAHRLDWTTGQLAEVLTRQYGREDQLALSPVSTPTPLPVRWEAADPAVSEHEANVLGLPAGAAESAEPLDVTGEFAEIGAFFTALPRQRLVVLGEPGAGKTVLAYRLARTLLEHRGPASGAPVPVVLPLASWDPADARGLWHWAAERLSAEHPALLPTPELALDLIESGRLLPVLDGFDELPEPVRADALSELRRSLAAPARCVLTSRVAEYTRAVRDAGGLPLPGAAAVRLCPLTAQDLAAYLPRTSGRTDTTWRPVLRQLADPADTAREVRVLRAVLSTPLMVALARVAYSGTGADPAELLGAGRFTIRQAVERHLYDAFFTAAYGRQADDATRWAGFLAARLRDAGRQDLAWWRLDEAVPGAVRALALLPGAAVAALTVHLAGIGTPWWDRWVAAPLWLVFGAALWLGFASDALTGQLPRGPQRVWWPRRARPDGAGARWCWWAGGALYLTALAAALWILSTISGELWGDSAVLAVACFICLPLTALLNRLRTPTDPETAPEPARLLRLDRRSVLALGAVGSGIAKSLDMDAAFARPRPFVGWVLVVTLGLWQFSGGRDVVTARTWAVVLAGAAVASYLHDFALSAWGRFTLARLWFTRHDQLPWRLMDFLRDAHRRGVLRQAGGVYRFRHIELRNRLAAHAPTRPRPSPGHVSKRSPRAGDARSTGHGPAGTLSGICAVLLLAASGYGTLKAAPAPFPHGTRPPACSVLSAHDRKALMDRPLTVQDGHTLCVAAEQSPFRPAVEIQIRLSADTATASDSGVDVARDDFRKRAAAERQNRNVPPRTSFLRGPALADQQLRLVGMNFPRAGVPRMRQARYYARDGNLRAYVFYAEEYASARRVSAVAESLLRKALDRPGARDLVSIPRTRVPERNRYAGYAREERSLHGAVWQGDEPSRILTFDRLSVPLRVPRQLECDTEYRDEDDAVESTTQALGLSAYVCKPPQDGLPARPAPRVRIDLAEMECGGRCQQRETRVFERTRPGAESVRWRRPHGTKDARYAVRKGAGSYEMHLLREYRIGPFDQRRLWLRVRVAPEHAELAQKIVNSAYTQTGGER
ncbi:NACHT domain-containing protein [Streptomyces sp. 8N114]|uniref:NACHT domain-containing protein n=1 Tax=Streptomyces sp. 8N114 TaxID=3457419 RepID=UPI003FD44307